MAPQRFGARKMPSVLPDKNNEGSDMRAGIASALFVAASCGSLASHAQQPGLNSADFCNALSRVEAQALIDRFRSWRGNAFAIWYRSTYVLPTAQGCTIDPDDDSLSCTWQFASGAAASQFLEALGKRIQACLPGTTSYKAPNGDSMSIESKSGRVEWFVLKLKEHNAVSLRVEPS